MKTILAFFLLTSLLAPATQPSLEMVKQPLFMRYSASSNRIQFVDVPVVILGAGAEHLISAIGMPFVPPASSAWTPGDVNLVSRYGIKIEALEKTARNRPPLSPFPIPPMTPPAKSKFLSASRVSSFLRQISPFFRPSLPPDPLSPRFRSRQ